MKLSAISLIMLVSFSFLLTGCPESSEKESTPKYASMEECLQDANGYGTQCGNY